MRGDRIITICLGLVVAACMSVSSAGQTSSSPSPFGKVQVVDTYQRSAEPGRWILGVLVRLRAADSGVGRDLKQGPYPGRLTRSARRVTLHLPARWPWAIGFGQALTRFRAIPLLA